MITVPQAGSIAGRAASNTPVATPELGSAISGLGQRMAELGQQWKAQDNAIVAQKTTLDMTKDLALARQDVAQIADPTAMTQAWTAKEAEIKQKYFADPNMDPDVRKQLDLNFQDLSTKHAVDLSGNVIALRQSQHVANYVTTSSALDALVPGADNATFEAVRAQKMAALDALAGTPGYDPAKIAAEKVAIDQQLYGQRASDAIAKDPAAFLTEAKAKNSPYAPLGDKLGAYEQLAQTTLAQNAKAAQTEADRQRNLVIKANNDVLDGIISLAPNGITAATAGMLNDPNFVANADPAKVAEAKSAYQLNLDMPTLRQMSLKERAQAIEVEKAQPKTQGYDANRLKVMEGMQADQTDAITKDGAAYFQSQGQGFAALPLDPQHIAELGPALKARLTDAAAATQGAGLPVQPLTINEQAQIKALLDPKAEPGTKVQIASALLEATQNKPQTLAATMGVDPVFSRALRIMAAYQTKPGDPPPPVASMMFDGQRKEAMGNVLVPSDAEQTRAFQAQTKGIFAADDPRAAEIKAAAIAVYGSLAGATPPDQAGVTWENNAKAKMLYTQALQMVLGGNGSDKLPTGGIQTIRKQPTHLPEGVSPDAVNQALTNIGYQFAGQGYDPVSESWTPDAGAGKDPNRAFKAASVFGNVPDFAGNDEAWAAHLTIRRVGETDQYQLWLPGQQNPVSDAQGNEYRFRMGPFLQGAAK